MTAFFLRFYWFFIKLFFFGRVFFLFINSDEFFSDLLILPYASWKALKMDISTISYLALPLLLLFFLLSYSNQTRRSKLVGFYLASIGVVTLVVFALDPFFFKYWGLKANTLAWKYAEGTKGLMSISWKDYIWATVYLLISLGVLRRRILKLSTIDFGLEWLKTFLFFLLISLLARGGTGKATIGYPQVNFTEKPYLNACAINPLWNLVAAEVNNDNLEEIEIDHKEDLKKILFKTGEQQTQSQFAINDSTSVILVVLESVNTKISRMYSGYDRDVCPHLDRLSSEVDHFKHAYAHSFRSDKGFAALLFGLPTTADLNPADFPLLLDKQNNLIRAFNDKNYHTQFVYGGDLSFANLHVLLRGVDEIVDEDDFEKGERNVWGYHDEFVYNMALEKLKTKTGPVFSVIYTSSSHEPFKVPMERKFKNDYENAVFYADQCLGDFVNNLKSSGIWENSMLIITSDHGSIYPDKLAAPEEENYAIPLIITGGAVVNGLARTKKPNEINQVVSQLDIAQSLSDWFGLGVDFKYSNNLYDSADRAFYNYYNGFAMISSDCIQWYDLPQKKYLKGPCSGPFEKVFFTEANREFFNPD